MPECSSGESAFGMCWKNLSATSGIMPTPMLIATTYGAALYLW